jgi:hypothetical protein
MIEEAAKVMLQDVIFYGLASLPSQVMFLLEIIILYLKYIRDS